MRLAYPDLLADLQSGSTVITPTPLLASIAIEQFNRAQLAQGAVAWERPAVYSLDVWLATCWQDARFNRPDVATLLSSLQERELWRRLIEADHPHLFDPGALANLAARSAHIQAEYQIAIDDPDWNEREDARQFLAWLRTLRSTCNAKGWIVRSDLWRALPEVGEKPIFAGFNQVSPSLKRFGAVASARGPSRKVEAAEFNSFADEVEHAARAARKLVEAGETSIAVFAPDLGRNAGLIKRTFDTVFYPSGGEDASAFHVSAGTLKDEPMIAGALLMLELANPRIDHAVAGSVLRSPFIAGAKEERSARALADVKLRRARELDVTLADMESASQACPQFMALLRNVRAVLQGLPLTQSPSAWSGLFSRLLRACGWPGKEPSLQQQDLIDAWDNALSALATLGLVAPKMDLRTAKDRLRGILSRPGQIGDWSSPIQILDSSSAAGLHFDHVVIIGLSEEAFLRPRPSSPLLPFHLQRRHQVPDVADVREASAFALFQSGANVRATFCNEIAPWVRLFVKSVVKRPAAAKQVFLATALDQIEDGTGPRLAPSSSVRGGASIIKAQSQCPFKAFAEFRLNASAPEDACFGYDARDRGGFTHKALELVWQELGSQATLKSLSSEDLRGLVQRSVLSAVKSTPEDGPLHQLASLAEQERLETLILAWLDVEKERQKSFTVEHIEHKRYYDAPGLRLKLRVDRIDRLANGSAVLIDYKTGKLTKNKLQGARPEEPQLLVYAAALGEPVEGLLFGELAATGPRLVGHSFGKHVKGGSVQEHKNDWDTFLFEAKEKVDGLAAEFVQGDAVVRPVKGTVCNYCGAMPLCRIHETGVADEDDD